MHFRRLAIAALVVGLLGAPLATLGGSVLASPKPAVTWLADVLPRLDLAQHLGAAPSGAPLDLVVALSHPDPAGEQAAYAAMYNPASPSFRRFLSPARYDQRFGVPAATVATAEAWLRSGGLHVVQASAAGDLIEVSGTTGAIARLFRTTIGSFAYQGHPFLANTTAIAVPAGLPVATVVGLNTLQRFRPADSLVPATSARAAAPPATFSGTFNERNLWKIYDLPDSNYAQGQSLGIFGNGDADPVVANLRVFELRQGLPKVAVKVVHTQPPGSGDVSGEVEWNLDSDASTGMAPMAHQLVYYFSNSLTDASVLTAFKAWADDPSGPLQASASFGECETNPLNPLFGGPLLDPNLPFGVGLGDNQELASEPILRQATLEGRTLFVSAGDTAGACPAVALPVIGAGNGVLPGTAPLQNYPAVSQYAVSVGGTVLTSNAAKTARAGEVAWTYTGGGSSGFVARPSFQKNVAAVNRACLVDPTGKPYPSGTVCRGVPDIAADSSGGVPAVSSAATYSVVEDMIDSPEGGTSLSAPLAAGMWARIQAAAPAGGLGFADESLYRAAAGSRYHRDFYDVTGSEFGVGNFFYQPGPGWDYTTGLGVMDVAHLMSDLTGRLTPTNPVGPAPVAPNAVSCGPIVPSPQGNAVDPVTLQNDSTVDFTGGRMALSADHKSLLVSMTGPGLAPTPPLNDLGGATYTVFWTWHGHTYFAQAQVAAPGVVSFGDGHVDSSQGAVVDNSVSGSFTNGVLQVAVPVKDVGNPPVGATLQYPYGVTAVFAAGVPGVVGALPLTVDAGSGADYRVGAVCAAAKR